MTELGNYIKEQRLKKGMSVSELSKKADISYNKLYYLEIGRIYTPKAVTLFRLSKVLDVEFEDILKVQYSKYPKKLERAGISSD